MKRPIAAATVSGAPGAKRLFILAPKRALTRVMMELQRNQQSLEYTEHPDATGHNEDEQTEATAHSGQCRAPTTMKPIRAVSAPMIRITKT